MLENHHKNGDNTDHFYHFQITITVSMSESIQMCKIVHFHGFQHPKLRVHPEPKVHDFAIRCMNFEHLKCHIKQCHIKHDHFEHLKCHIKHGEDILARQMVFRGPAPDVCIKQFLKFGHWFYA